MFECLHYVGLLFRDSGSLYPEMYCQQHEQCNFVTQVHGPSNFCVG
jgi:hypothetical protein